MKILAIVVTFYPQKELLLNNINAFLEYVEKVIIWENTPEEEKLNYRYINNSKIEYYGDGINSISHGLNFAWKYAKDNGYNFILTMDQDSTWIGFDKFVKTVSNGMPFGLWGPVVNRRQDLSSFHEVPALITSGMLVNLDILNRIGGYDERFRVDGIDMDFCFRAKTFGIHSYQVNSGILLQNFGQPIFVNIGVAKIAVSGYSSSRRYYTARSKAMLIRKYRFRFLSVMKLIYVEFILKIFYIWIGEESKLEKTISSYKGFISGLMEKDLGYVNKSVKVI